MAVFLPTFSFTFGCRRYSFLRFPDEIFLSLDFLNSSFFCFFPWIFLATFFSVALSIIAGSFLDEWGKFHDVINATELERLGPFCNS
jgi:hypothetical protein